MRIFTLLVFSFPIFISIAQVSQEEHNAAVDLIMDAKNEIESGSYTAAVVLLNKAIELNPEIKESYSLLNTALDATGDKVAQKKNLLKALSLFKEEEGFHYSLGNLFQKEGNLDDAIKYYSNAIKFKKAEDDNGIVYAYFSNRGICYLKKEMFSESLVDLDTAIKFNPYNGGIYTNRGYVLFKLNKKAEACKSWSKAIELREFSARKYKEKYCR